MKQRSIFRLKLLLLVILLLIQGCASKNAATPTSNSVGSGRFINPGASNFAIIVLDYQTLALKSAYTEIHSPCKNQVDDEVIKSRVSGFFQAVTDHSSNRIDKVQRVGDFALAEIEPGDFGGAAILDPCTGLVLFAGSVVWEGVGEQKYPASPIRSQDLQYKTGQVPLPQRIDAKAGPDSPGTDGYEKAWSSVQSLNLVQDFASAPYSVFVYLYPRAVGLFSPKAAEWVILIHQGLPQ